MEDLDANSQLEWDLDLYASTCKFLPQNLHGILNNEGCANYWDLQLYAYCFDLYKVFRQAFILSTCLCLNNWLDIIFL